MPDALGWTAARGGGRLVRMKGHLVVLSLLAAAFVHAQDRAVLPEEAKAPPESPAQRIKALTGAKVAVVPSETAKTLSPGASLAEALSIYFECTAYPGAGPKVVYGPNGPSLKMPGSQ
jgi:hypothetical protein